MSRNRRDALLEVTKALPAAAANNNTDAIDLEQVAGGDLEAIEFEVSVPALPALVEDKTVTITVEDSANGTDFDALDPAITTVITGGAGNGADAKTVRFRLPSTARRHVRLNQAVLAAGGNNTGVSTTFRLLA
jgi:hypothetical protein